MDYFKHICRICLEQNQMQTFDIFTSYYSKRNTLYSDMLIYCTKLKPSREDALPHLICKECSKQLKRTYAFNILCEESDRTLKDLLEKAQLQSKSEEIDIPIKNEDNSLVVCVNETLYSDNFDLKNEELLESLSDNIKLEPSCNLNDDGNWNHYNSSLLVKGENDKLNVSDENYTDHGEESCWDADDDNVILKDIKSKKKLKVKITEDKPKKKRGRKKKVYLDGDLPAPPESKLPHQCDICGKFLSTRSNLKAHKICHTDQRPFKCADCPAAFKGYSALYQHRKVHTGETPYQCEYCNKRFRRRTGLVNHIRIHTGEKLYSCDICFKTFIQSAQLSIHMKRHKGDKAFLCQDCGKGFLIKADLRVHQRIHNGEKPYSCHLCTKTFATAGNLSIHVRIHKKEIRYHCGECQRGFVTKSAFNVHVKRHKNQRDYQCDCGKTFFTSSALKQHRVVHTGEKRYQCKICDRKFSQNSHLNRHFKKDHGKPNAPLPAANEYKVIVQENKNIFGLFDIQKMTPNTNVKCEGS